VYLRRETDKWAIVRDDKASGFHLVQQRSSYPAILPSSEAQSNGSKSEPYVNGLIDLTSIKHNQSHNLSPAHTAALKVSQVPSLASLFSVLLTSKSKQRACTVGIYS